MDSVKLALAPVECAWRLSDNAQKNEGVESPGILQPHHLEMGLIPLHDKVEVNYEKGSTTDMKAQVLVFGLGVNVGLI